MLDNGISQSVSIQPSLVRLLPIILLMAGFIYLTVLNVEAHQRQCDGVAAIERLEERLAAPGGE
jgi:hypothetical protein